MQVLRRTTLSDWVSLLPRLSKLASTLLLLVSMVAGGASLRAERSDSILADAVDLGSLPDSAPIRRMQLVLARSAEQEERLEALLAAQQRVGSPDYQKWLTPAEFGEKFGPAAAATDQLTGWLRAQGFTEIKLSAGRTLIEFSGSAGGLRAAFGADVHGFANASGEKFATLRGPVNLPAQFAPMLQGFRALGVTPAVAPQGRELRRDNATGAVTLRIAPGAHPDFTLSSNATIYYAVTPYDFATIYNVLPLWNATSPIDGTGQTIAVAGDTDINPADFVSFRNLFGLPIGNTATPTGTQYLNIIYNGPKPAFQTDEFHAASDTQWAGAAAKGATIDYVASQSTEVSAGVDLSAAYIVDNNLAPVLVASYSSCELSLGTAGNGFYKALWQQAAAQGIAVVTATDDSGAAACDGAHVGPAARGIAINGMGSTPYDVSVGATEFYTPNGSATYFSATNSSNFSSATGYIPEQVWNDSCTNPLILASAPYAGLTAEQACNSAAAQAAGLVVTAGSGGGASSCVSSDARNPATCTGGYAKPTWQAGPGVPADGVRDTPDVALFGSQGRTNNFYVVCQQSRNMDGQACNLNAPYSDFSGYGGTELTAPAFAGILALAGQKQASATGGRLGNPNIVLYALAARQAAAGLACNSTGTLSPGCYFHDITTGTNAMPCVTLSANCVSTTQGGAYGILSGNAATTGYDKATGLGSVDAANLVNAWTTTGLATSSAVLSILPVSVVHGTSVIATVTVAGKSPSGQVSLNSQVANGSVGAGPLVNGTLSASFRNFPGGTYGVRAHYEGDAQNYPADSNFVSITVAPEASSTTLRALAYNPATGSTSTPASAQYGTVFFLRADVVGQSGQGVATGNVSLTDNGSILGAGVSRLNSSGYTEFQTNAFTPGLHTFAGSYGGDASFNPSSAPGASVTITKAATTTSLTATPASVSQAGVVTLSAKIATTGYGFAAPSGPLAFMSGAIVLGTSTLVAGNDATTFYRNATATLTVSAGSLPPGTNNITAVFPGDSNYVASTSPAAVVNVSLSTLPTCSVALLITPGQVAPNGMVVLGATVTPGVTGAVQFAIDGQNVATPVTLSNSQGAYGVSVTPYVVGLHSATALYTGGTAYRSCVSAATPFFITAPMALGVPMFTVTPSMAVQGTFISVAAKVTPSAATGRVQLVLDGAPYGATFLLSNGGAQLPLSTGTVQTGPHSLTVYYAGDTNYAASYAVPQTITIQQPGTTPSAVTISNLGPTIAVGAAGNFTATVTPLSPVPTGIFELTLDGGTPGAPILVKGATNTLTLPAAGLTVGTHTLSVFYSGDATYNVSTSTTVTYQVASSIVTGDFTLSPKIASLTTSRLAGTNPTLLYHLSANGGFTGLVQFSCTNLPVNTACVFSPGTVNVTGTGDFTTTLTLVLNTGKKSGSLPLPGLGLAALCGLGLAFHKRRRWLALCVLGCLAAVSGCGGGYATGDSAAGTYQVNVIATSGSLQQIATITLTIQ